MKINVPLHACKQTDRKGLNETLLIVAPGPQSGDSYELYFVSINANDQPVARPLLSPTKLRAMNDVQCGHDQYMVIRDDMLEISLQKEKCCE